MTSPSERPTRKPHRLPLATYASPHHVFSFTVCAASGTRPFEGERLSRMVVDSLLWTRERYHWLLFAYCLMPDHLHFVGRLTTKDEAVGHLGKPSDVLVGVLEHVARFKSYTANEARRLGRSGPLWQKSSYDRLLDTDEKLETVVEYVLDNPVRAGLCDGWADWPHSGKPDPL